MVWILVVKWFYRKKIFKPTIKCHMWMYIRAAQILTKTLTYCSDGFQIKFLEGLKGPIM